MTALRFKTSGGGGVGETSDIPGLPSGAMQKDKRGDNKVESNDSPEIQDGRGGGRHQTFSASLRGPCRRPREEIASWNQMTALRFKRWGEGRGGGIRHPRPPFGGHAGETEVAMVMEERQPTRHHGYASWRWSRGKVVPFTSDAPCGGKEVTMAME